ncbi:Rpn family recombination-promoting nuclease/putative transposase [Bordetella genomosp. 13]|uniref:Rpn family recombination-promoting nuclease/putative transposase n=1 Tax=Bordetella genomosp. 13 TaxID=463040 RepID=UPI001642F918|nr:Rpn family recombination-promoting nuclease/putative transposase [Bordetella genomosp. 13]
MTRHDTLYKRLFSHPPMMRSLLQGFTPESWTRQLDWSTLEKRSAEFVAENRRTRRGDLVWRVRAGRDGPPVYLLLEFQSRVDARMALRMMTYLGLFCEELVRQDSVGRLPLALPPVLPMVLYSGVSRWRAACDIGDLFLCGPDVLQPYRPRLRYLLIDQIRAVRSAELPEENLAAAFFQIESGASVEVFLAALQTLHRGTLAPEMAELRGDLVLWLRAHRELAEQAIKLLESQDMETEMGLFKRAEANRMRAMIGQMAHEALEAEARRKFAQGIEQGIRTAGMAMLERQLSHRFGPLPPDLQARLASAPAEQIQQWAIAVLDASSPEEVFALPGH